MLFGTTVPTDYKVAKCLDIIISEKTINKKSIDSGSFGLT